MGREREAIFLSGKHAEGLRRGSDQVLGVSMRRFAPPLEPWFGLCTLTQPLTRLASLRSTLPRGWHMVENKYLIVITDFQERVLSLVGVLWSLGNQHLGSVPLLQYSGKHHYNQTEIPEAFQSRHMLASGWPTHSNSYICFLFCFVFPRESNQTKSRKQNVSQFVSTIPPLRVASGDLFSFS